MKKKLAAILLCAAVSLAAGCDKKNDTVSTPNTAGTLDTSSTVSTPNTSSTLNTSTAEGTSDTSDAESTPESDVSTPASENSGFVRGKWDGDVFTSDFFGITVTLNEECVKSSDEDLALMNGTADISDAEFIGAVENSDGNTAVYELFAQYQDKGNIALAYNRYDGSLDEYVTANAAGLKLSGMFEDTEIGTVNIGGKEQKCLYTTLVSGEQEVSEIMIMYKNGDYFAILTMGAMTKDDLQYMIKNLLG